MSFRNKSILYSLFLIAFLVAIVVSCGSKTGVYDSYGLKDAFDGKFLIGCAINDLQVTGIDSIGARLVKQHFNTVVAEDVMKSEKLNPRQGYYNWGPADAFVKFSEDNGMFAVGHCLIWHSQLAKWFAYDYEGCLVSPDSLRHRMHEYIHDVVGRYKGKIHGWDVVNEAILDDGEYRRSPFYLILGEDYIPYAFQLAHEADPEAQLYINDYGMDKPARRNRYVQIVNDLKKRGLRIDAIGMQAHMGIDYPDLNLFEEAIKTLASTGCNVMVTEWDMSALPTFTTSANISESIDKTLNLNPYPHGLPANIENLWNRRMDSVMNICLRNSDIISRINVWGVQDGNSWKNNWPVKGRTDYPLLFDRAHKPKPFLKKYLQQNT